MTEPTVAATHSGPRRWALDLTPLRTSRDFRLSFAASAVSMLGSMITYVAIPYQVAVLTGSPLMVGLLGVVEFVPILVMSLVGGALADYVDRRRLVLLSEAAFMVVTGVLVLNAAFDRPQVWVLFLCAGTAAGLDGIQRPALDAMTPRLVSPQELPAASALSSLRGNAASLAGPALGGLLIATVDLPWVYTVDLATFAFSLAMLTLVRAVPPPPDADRPSVRGIVDGLRYARGRPELLGTYLVDINAMFFAMPAALYPFVAADFGGPEVLGLLYTAPSAGALLATLTSGWSGHVHRHGLMVILGAGTWGLAVIGFGLSTSLWVALAFLALAGAADMVSGMFRGIIWNQTIPDHLRGRLAGIEMVSYTSGPSLGNLRAGVAARFVGVEGSVVGGGVLCVVGTLALAAWLRSFVRYDGREGLARKQAEDAARREGATRRTADG